MSLDYRLGDIENWKETCYSERECEGGEIASEMNIVTQAIIFYTIPLGINLITEQNADKFFDRMEFYDKVNGCLMYDSEGNDRPITAEEVKAHIGLSTNAAELSGAKFYASIGKDK